MNIAEQIALKYIKSYQCNSYQHCFQDTSRQCVLILEIIDVFNYLH